MPQGAWMRPEWSSRIASPPRDESVGERPLFCPGWGALVCCVRVSGSTGRGCHRGPQTGGHSGRVQQGQPRRSAWPPPYSSRGSKRAESVWALGGAPQQGTAAVQREGWPRGGPRRGGGRGGGGGGWRGRPRRRGSLRLPCLSFSSFLLQFFFCLLLFQLTSRGDQRG